MSNEVDLKSREFHELSLRDFERAQNFMTSPPYDNPYYGKSHRVDDLKNMFKHLKARASALSGALLEGEESLNGSSIRELPFRDEAARAFTVDGGDFLVLLNTDLTEYLGGVQAGRELIVDQETGRTTYGGYEPELHVRSAQLTLCALETGRPLLGRPQELTRIRAGSLNKAHEIACLEAHEEGLELHPENYERYNLTPKVDFRLLAAAIELNMYENGWGTIGVRAAFPDRETFFLHVKDRIGGMTQREQLDHAKTHLASDLLERLGVPIEKAASLEEPRPAMSL